MPESDEQLVGRVGAGEVSAFSSLYARYAPRIQALLLKLLKNRQQVDDVLQETFWQVWRSASDYDPARATAAAWMLLIARSRAIDAIRREARTKVPTLSSDPVVRHDPSLAIQALELAENIRSAILQLDPNQQQAIYLSYYCGLPQQMISHELQIPLGTVKTRMRAAMMKLRGILRDLKSEAT